jgi:hypothetical protein
MSFHAANPASFSHLSSCAVESVNKSLSTRNYGGELRPSSYGGTCPSNRTAIAVNFRSRCADDNFALERVCRYVSVFCLVTASGPFRRPAALCLLLRIARPFGVSVPPKTSLRTVAKNASQTSFGSLPESRPSALGSRAHSLSSAQCDPSNNGRIQQTETLSCTRTK